MKNNTRLRLAIIGVTLWLAASANAAYNASDNAADPAYNGGWRLASNGGYGFGPWRLYNDPSQYAIINSPGIDVSNKSWAITAEYGTSAIRPLAGGTLAVGQRVQVSWGLPGTNADNTQVMLLDAAENPIINLLLIPANVLLSGGYLGVAINNVWVTGAGVPWATNGASVLATLTLSRTNAIDLNVVSGTNSVSLTNFLFTGSISAVALYVAGPNDPALPDKTAYFNSLSVSSASNQVAPPVLNPSGGRLTNGQTVIMTTTTPGASIRYTTDGTLPSSTLGTLYRGPVPFSLVQPMTLNAIAYKTDMPDSPISSGLYQPASPMAVGINLEEVGDGDPSWPFVDVFKRVRPWLTYANDHYREVWDSGFGPLIPVDTNGWPTQVPFAVNGTNQIVHTILTALNEPGTYNFIYEGTGELLLEVPTLAGRAAIAYLTATGGIQTFSFTTITDAIALIEIHHSAANDYLRNFHLVLTNFLSTYQTQPFHPLFLQRLQPFKCVRFVHWAMTDDQWDLTTTNARTSWTNRTTPSYYTQFNQNGVALEYMAQLCNTLQADAWICIPHAADDDYIRQAARLLRDSLSPNLVLYVEYSNETWNGGYTQRYYVEAMGVSLNLDPNPFGAAQKYVARRSGQMWNIFQQVFGSAARSRLVKVMATAWLGVTDMRVSALLDTDVNTSGVLPDALAIAPYFGKGFTLADLPPNAAYPTVDDILTNLSVQSIAEQQLQVGFQKTRADAQGWRLVCYEGGQTFVGIQDAQNDTNLTAILTAANRDLRMFTLYTQYLDMLKAQGVDLFNHLSYCGNWGKYGNWGALEYVDQPTNSAPKYAALVQWIAAHPVPAAPIVLTPATTTNGAVSFVFTNNHDASFTVLTTTNLAFPLADWTVLGAPAETAPGTYQFTSSITTNESRQFYRVRSP
jgi:hypothetical protein